MAWQGDVLIVGGGPAGSAAAITAARAGLSVAILERTVFPRKRPGETLHPGIESLFDQLGVAEAIAAEQFLRPTGYRVRWGMEREQFVTFGATGSTAWCGFQATRARLDSLLLEQSRKVGAQIFQPVRARTPILQGNRVVGIETDQGIFEAQFILVRHPVLILG